jgi:hypothetical protein
MLAGGVTHQEIGQVMAQVGKVCQKYKIILTILQISTINYSYFGQTRKINLNLLFF